MTVLEIPEQLESFNIHFCFEFCDSLYGPMNPENHLIYSAFQTCTLYQAINRALQSSDATFVTFKGHTYIIIKDSDGFYVFDPHARDRSDKLSSFGKVFYCSEIVLMISFCIAKIWQNQWFVSRYKQFEITGVKVQNFNQRRVNLKLEIMKFPGYKQSNNGIQT